MSAEISSRPSPAPYANSGTATTADLPVARDGGGVVEWVSGTSLLGFIEANRLGCLSGPDGLIRIALSGIAALIVASSLPAQVINREPTQEREAVIIPFDGMIQPLSAATFERKFQDALDSDAEVIILDIDSPGGFTEVTFDLMDRVMAAEGVTTVAYVERDAISGAALLSLACDEIYMRADARIGDAGEITLGAGGEWRYTEAKRRSYLAQKVRDTAEATGRPVALAEKLVDQDLVVFSATVKATGEQVYFSDREWEALEDPSLYERGKPIREAGEEMFLTLNGRRAAELGFIDDTVGGIDDLADRMELRQPIPVLKRTWVDTTVVLLNSWPLTLLLIAVGMVALIIELGAPGISVGGLTSLLCFSLFFWSRFLGGTSGWLEVTLFAVGLVFIACEFFVIPGFGIAGIGGLTLVFTSLVMASQRFFIPGSSQQWTDVGWDALTVLGAFVTFLIALVAVSNYLGAIPGLSRLTLVPPPMQTLTAAELAGKPEAVPGWQTVEIGDVGTSEGPLRPSGRVRFGEQLIDVVTEGDFVDGDRRVRVLSKQGARIVVRETA